MCMLPALTMQSCSTVTKQDGQALTLASRGVVRRLFISTTNQTVLTRISMAV
jgi:hypothetical protein